jgi:endo-1,4-beta-xylanase
MGLSAGGELAEVVAIKNDKGNADATDPIEKQSCRPDFQVLIYPGTSNLIEPTADSPPAFLAAGNNDRPDISVGLAEAYLRFKKVNIPVELHIYAATGHGFGIRDTQPAPSHQAWPVSMVAWLKQMKLMDVK